MPESSSLEELRVALFDYVGNNPDALFADIRQRFDLEQLGYRGKPQIERDARAYEALRGFVNRFASASNKNIFRNEILYGRLHELAAAIYAGISPYKDLSVAVLSENGVKKEDIRKVSVIMAQYFSQNPPRTTWDYLQELRRTVREEYKKPLRISDLSQLFEALLPLDDEEIKLLLEDEEPSEEELKSLPEDFNKRVLNAVKTRITTQK